MLVRNVKIFITLMMMAFIHQGLHGMIHAETDVPMIQIEKRDHTFPVVFEGEMLSHSFTVKNKGGADLYIKRVSTS